MPAARQFLSRDPLVRQTRNPYSYVAGNPLNETDPNGACGLWGSDTCWGDAAGWVNQNIVQPVSQFVQQNSSTFATITSTIATVASGVATVCAAVAAVATLGAAEEACGAAGVVAVGAGALTTVFDSYLASQNNLRGGWGTVVTDTVGTVSGGLGEWAQGGVGTAMSFLGFSCSYLNFNVSLGNH